jgi:hypothetical protein
MENIIMDNTLIATIENLEVRKVTKYSDKDEGWYHLIVTFEDEDCNRFYFVDDDMSRESRYQRGTFGTLKLNIATSENILNDFGNINYEILAEIYDFIPDDDRNN